jgi:hypothetical protein
MGKSAANDTHDGDDDQLQRFSKGVATLFLEMRDGAMGGNMGSTSATKSDAGVKLGVPTSSRTSPAGIEIAVPPSREEPALLNTTHPCSDPQDLGERQRSNRTRCSR